MSWVIEYIWNRDEKKPQKTGHIYLTSIKLTLEGITDSASFITEK